MYQIRGIKKSVFLAFLIILTMSLPLYAKSNQKTNSGVTTQSLSEETFPPYFRPYVIYPAVSISGSIGIGDFNNDGLLDVVESNSDFYIREYQINVFLQNSLGAFESPIAFETGERPESLATGDINNDGKDDIVVANIWENTISVFLQLDNGTIAPQVKYMTLSHSSPYSGAPCGIEVGDLNNDTLNDVVVTHHNTNQLSVFLQQSDGTLGNYISYWSPWGGHDDIGVGDLNNDGLTDVVNLSGYDLSVYLQNQEGVLDLPIIYNFSSTGMGHGIAVGDITGDGLDDIALSYGSNRPRAFLAVYAQTDSGTLSLDAIYDAYEIPHSVAISDVNMDGKSDVLVTHASWRSLSIHLQNSVGKLDSYSLYSLPYYANYPSQALDTGDLNNDGFPDVAFAHYLGPAILYHYPVFFTNRMFLPYVDNK